MTRIPLVAGAFAALMILAACEQAKDPGDAPLTTKADASNPLRASGADEEALVAYANAPWTGDLDGMLERGFIRLLTVYNPLFFHYDGPEKKGIIYDWAVEFENDLNKGRKRTETPVRILMMPMPRDQLLSALNKGLGDIVAANLTITPEREKLVQFLDPSSRNVDEVVVTHAGGPEIASLDDLVGLGVGLRKSSSYFEHLSQVNRERKKAGKKAIAIQEMDERLEDYDLLEMVNAGMLPSTIVDSHKAKLWVQVFDKLVVNETVTVNTGGRIAWAMRKDSPKLLAAVNGYVEKARIGTLLGNIIANRYFKNTRWVETALSADGMAQYKPTIELIQTYADRYDFDWVMVLAQAYQESKLKQDTVSRVGAVGVMQILPRTAADPVVGIPDVSSEEQNIHAGVKYLRFLRDRYFSDPAIQRLDQVLLSLAAYNAGPAGIARARNRADEMGLDRNVWFDNVEVATAAAVSREPVIYVRNIFKYYVNYKWLEVRRLERQTAKNESR